MNTENESNSVSSSPASPLHAAVKLGDRVRSCLTRIIPSTENEGEADEMAKKDFRMTPGVLEGMAAGAASFLILTPVRTRIVKAVGKQMLGELPDLILFTSQIMLAANVTLYAGSLYGSYHYLRTFNSIPVHAVSPTVDEICQTAAEFQPLYHKVVQDKISTSSTLDPRASVLEEFSKALKLCTERSAHRKEREDFKLK